MINPKYPAIALAATLATTIIASRVEAGVMILSGPDSNAGTYSSADLAGNNCAPGR